MVSLGNKLVIALTPYLGTATEAYVESLATGVGKRVDALDADDFVAIEDELRATISAVAASGTIQSIIDDIRSGL